MAATGETIVALSSGRPPAAIAVIRISGEAAAASAISLAGKLPNPRQAALRTLRDPGSGEAIDDALTLFFPGPKSATGEDIVEFQCHGSRAIVDRLIEVLTALDGVRLAEPGEFTRRALANGLIDLTEAEGLADLLAAETELQRKVALVRASGGLRAKLDSWRQALVRLSADAEVAIDYPDEEDGVMAPDLRPAATELLNEIRDLLDAPRTEKLRDGIRVVLAGPPNAGKSSLINALTYSERAIVTPIAGTTRDTIEIPIAMDGMPFVFVDTAGLRDANDEVEAIGVGRARDEMAAADIILWLGPDHDIPDSARTLLLRPKADLGSSGAGLPVSSKTGLGLSDLRQRLLDRARATLPSGVSVMLTNREASLLGEIHTILLQCIQVAAPEIRAELLRQARELVDQITGRAGVENVLDELFSRFCLGK